jgi:hypothetical protein
MFPLVVTALNKNGQGHRWSMTLRVAPGLQAAGRADWLVIILVCWEGALFSFSWLSKRPGFSLSRKEINPSIPSVIRAGYHCTL